VCRASERKKQEINGPGSHCPKYLKSGVRRSGREHEDLWFGRASDLDLLNFSDFELCGAVSKGPFILIRVVAGFTVDLLRET